MGLLLSTDDGQQVSTSSNTSLVRNNAINTTTDATPLQALPSDHGTNETISNLADLGGGLDLPPNKDDLITQTPTTNLNLDYANNTIPLNGTSNESDFKLHIFGTYYYPFKWLTLANLYSSLGPLSSLAMILGCVMPYVPQYKTIRKNRNCSGFSTFVCLTLLLSNILRIAFWFGHRFELPLLVQSVVMILAQILLLELCVRVKRQSSIPSVKRAFFSFKLQYFWRWTSLSSYLEFLFVLALSLGVLTYFLLNCKLYIETLGYCALVTESMLGLPQVIKNYRNKSVQGMSLSMVLMWLAGDIFKTVYYIANKVPYQFWLCGLLQISIDLLILFQVCLFKQRAPSKMNQTADDSPKEVMAL